eukprot:s2538_g7.t1
MGLCKDRGVLVRRVCDLDELSDKAACAGAVCLVVCSTYGHGDFPQNAGLFWSSLSAQNLASKELSDLRFCVFGMGDCSYADSFCEAAKKIEGPSAFWRWVLEMIEMRKSGRPAFSSACQSFGKL